MQMDKWDGCAFPIDESELVGRDCYGGLDLSSSSDITAFVLVFPPRNKEEKYIILPYCWIPEDNMRLRVRRDHVPYDVWAAEGCLQTTEGNVIHYGFIEKFIEKLGMKYHIKEIAFDRWGQYRWCRTWRAWVIRCAFRLWIWTGQSATDAVKEVCMMAGAFLCFKNVVLTKLTRKSKLKS